MDSDMKIDLQKYEEEHKKIKKEIAIALSKNEDITSLRKRLGQVLFNIEFLKSEIKKIDENMGGKTKW